MSANSFKFKQFLKEFNPHIVGVSVWSLAFNESILVLKIAKQINRNVITVIGGPHPTAYPDKTMENEIIDFLFRGEAELSFPAFLEELKNDVPDYTKVNGLVYRWEEKVKKNEVNYEFNLDNIKIPDYDSINLEEYINNGYRYCSSTKNAPIWLTRGCPYRCEFCCAPILNGRLIRSHSINYAVNWIKYLHLEKGIKYINIIDDNFTFNINYAKAFCQAIISLHFNDLHFGTPNGIRIQKSDPELFKLMKTAGWEIIIVAPESGSKRVLKLMKKDLDPNIIPERVKEIKNAGLKVFGAFIVGYQGETKEDIKETEKLIKKCEVNLLGVFNFQPLPGTPIYNKLVHEGKISDHLLPKGYTIGLRTYTPENLQDFNFSKFILRMHLYVCLRDPRNIFLYIKRFDIGLIIKKFIQNFMKAIFH